MLLNPLLDEGDISNSKALRNGGALCKRAPGITWCSASRNSHGPREAVHTLP